MDLSTLKPAPGSVQGKGKRLGRGEGSGKGGQATKGHKGQKAISGYSKKVGFEGGQMPLQRRLPKYGFKNVNTVKYKAVNLSAIDEFVKQTQISVIDVEVLMSYGFVPKNCLVKILGNGTLSQKVDITAHAFSKSAVAAIEAQGGTAVIA